jgi:choline dehydrogenase
MNCEYDYVIVGAGAAGCTLAHRLSSSGAKVLLVEAGAPATLPSIHDPSVWPALQNSAVDWRYRTTPQHAAAGRVYEWPRGKVVGGSTSINAMVYVRGHQRDFDAWVKAGNSGWSYADVVPHFQAVEDVIGISDGADTTNLSSNAKSGSIHHSVSDAFLAACADLKQYGTHNAAGAALTSAGFYSLTIKDGRRHSAADAFLTPVRGRPNLQVLTDAHVTRILTRGSVCTGVAYVQNGAEHVASATSQVVLAAGAIGSPQILMLSGIGPARDLEKLGIKVAIELPGVGQGLQDQLIVGVVYSAGQPVAPTTNNRSECGAYFTSVEGSSQSDLQLICIQAAYHPDARVRAAHHNSYSIAAGLMQPLSRGSVRLMSGDPFDHPLIEPNYLSRTEDLDALVEGVEIAREIGAHNAFDKWRREEVLPGVKVAGRAGVAKYALKANNSFHHPTGTCSMGVDGTAVVDPLLRVRGIERLRVADASIMPTIVSSNTCATTMMIADKAAHLILSE